MISGDRSPAYEAGEDHPAVRLGAGLALLAGGTCVAVLGEPVPSVCAAVLITVVSSVLARRATPAPDALDVLEDVIDDEND